MALAFAEKETGRPIVGTIHRSKKHYGLKQRGVWRNHDEALATAVAYAIGHQVEVTEVIFDRRQSGYVYPWCFRNPVVIKPDGQIIFKINKGSK